MSAQATMFEIEIKTDATFEIGDKVCQARSGRKGTVVSFGEMKEMMYEIRWKDGQRNGIMKASEIVSIE